MTFVDLLHELDTHEYAPRIVELLEAEHWLNPGLDTPVVLLDDVVQVRTGANLYGIVPAEVEVVPHAHPAQGRMGWLKAVEGDGPRLAVTVVLVNPIVGRIAEEGRKFTTISTHRFAQRGAKPPVECGQNVFRTEAAKSVHRAEK